MYPARMLLAFTMSLGLSFLAHATESAGVMGYQSWKTTRIEEARTILDRIQSEAQVDRLAAGERASMEKNAVSSKGPAKGSIHDAKNGSTSDVKKGDRKKGILKVDQRVQQAELNLEIARELTVNDYFVLYLNQFKTRDAYLDAAKKLTPEETADLMMSYQKLLSKGSEPAEPLPIVLPAKATPGVPPNISRNP